MMPAGGKAPLDLLRQNHPHGAPACMSILNVEAPPRTNRQTSRPVYHLANTIFMSIITYLLIADEDDIACNNAYHFILLPEMQLLLLFVLNQSWTQAIGQSQPLHLLQGK